jgi:predicted DNA-binding transcriptional regulator YafY
MDELIRKNATGSPDEFARKLGVSRSTLDKYLRVLKEMNAPIKYNEVLGNYYYLIPCQLKIAYETKVLTDMDLKSINKKSLQKFCEIVLT